VKYVPADKLPHFAEIGCDNRLVACRSLHAGKWNVDTSTLIHNGEKVGTISPGKKHIVDINTKVQIMAGRDDLYDLEFEDNRMSTILELLMRRYTGIFSYPVAVDEDYFAMRVGVPVPMFRQLLYKLALEHVIRYIPADHATVLFLHHDRLRPKNLNLDLEKYERLKASADERTMKMADYVQQEEICRSSYLLEYFGQSEAADCGTCDVCRAKKAMPSRD
jgi:ATP-dependent DNA helicase RecQ